MDKSGAFTAYWTRVGLALSGDFAIIVQIGLLAQLVEQLTLNQRVVGSIPSQPTNQNRHLGRSPRCLFLAV